MKKLLAVISCTMFSFGLLSADPALLDCHNKNEEWHCHCHKHKKKKSHCKKAISCHEHHHCR